MKHHSLFYMYLSQLGLFYNHICGIIAKNIMYLLCTYRHQYLYILPSLVAVKYGIAWALNNSFCITWLLLTHYFPFSITGRRIGFMKTIMWTSKCICAPPKKKNKTQNKTKQQNKNRKQTNKKLSVQPSSYFSGSLAPPSGVVVLALSSMCSTE